MTIAWSPGEVKGKSLSHLYNSCTLRCRLVEQTIKILTTDQSLRLQLQQQCRGFFGVRKGATIISSLLHQAVYTNLGLTNGMEELASCIIYLDCRKTGLLRRLHDHDRSSTTITVTPTDIQPPACFAHIDHKPTQMLQKMSYFPWLVFQPCLKYDFRLFWIERNVFLYESDGNIMFLPARQSRYKTCTDKAADSAHHRITSV